MRRKAQNLPTIIAVASWVLCFQLMSAFTPCQPTNYDLVGSQILARQKEYNCTFSKVNERMTPFGNVTLNTSQNTQYMIYNIVSNFYYNDSQQQARILGNDTILIYGGQVQASLKFDWTKNSLVNRSGTGEASGQSDVLYMAKEMIVHTDGSYSYELLDYTEVQWTMPASLNPTKYQPVDISEEDKLILTKMLNNIVGVKTVTDLLEEQIGKSFGYYMRACLQDENHHVAPQFDYVWMPSQDKPSITISMNRKVYSIDVQVGGIQDGINAYYQVQPQGSTESEWICGSRGIPYFPLNPLIYGRNQKIVSLDFYQNMILYASTKGYLDAQLNRQQWQSQQFHFLAGDLYQIFPLLASKFNVNQTILGSCTAVPEGIKVWRASEKSFNVSIQFDCEINILKDKILDFSVDLNLSVAGIPDQTNLTFRLIKHEALISFYPSGQYKMQNQDLAQKMVKDSLQNLYNGYLYGSRWPQSPPIQYPHFLVLGCCTVVYDLREDGQSVGVLPGQKQLRMGKTI